MLISAYTVLQADYPIPNFDLFDDEEWSVMPDGTSSSYSPVQPGEDITSVEEILCDHEIKVAGANGGFPSIG